MPLALLALLGVVAVGAGGYAYMQYEKQKEFEYKKSYAECVRTLATKYKMKPAEAAHYCRLDDVKMDMVNIALLGATVSVTLLGLKILLGGSECKTQLTQQKTKLKA